MQLPNRIWWDLWMRSDQNPREPGTAAISGENPRSKRKAQVAVTAGIKKHQRNEFN